MCVVATVAYRVEMMTTLKIRIVSASNYQFSPAGRCLIQPLLESLNTVQAKTAQSKGSSSPRWGPFQLLGPNQR